LARQQHIVKYQDFKKNMQENASFPQKEPGGLGGNRCFCGGNGWKWSTAGSSVH